MNSTYELVKNILDIDGEIITTFTNCQFRNKKIESHFQNFRNKPTSEKIYSLSFSIFILNLFKLICEIHYLGLQIFSLLIVIIDLFVKITTFIYYRFHKKNKKINWINLILIARFIMLIINFMISIFVLFFSDLKEVQFCFVKLIYTTILLKNFIFIFYFPEKILLGLVIYGIMILIILFIIIYSNICYVESLNSLIINNNSSNVKEITINIFNEKFSFFKNTITYFEIIFEILLFIMSILIKKYLNFTSRNTYLERYKFKKFFKYCDQLISGLNGFHLTYLKQDLIFINRNLRTILKENKSYLLSSNQYVNGDIIMENKNKQHNFSEEISDYLHKKYNTIKTGKFNEVFVNSINVNDRKFSRTENFTKKNSTVEDEINTIFEIFLKKMKSCKDENKTLFDKIECIKNKVEIKKIKEEIKKKIEENTNIIEKNKEFQSPNLTSFQTNILSKKNNRIINRSNITKNYSDNIQNEFEVKNNSEVKQSTNPNFEHENTLDPILNTKINNNLKLIRTNNVKNDLKSNGMIKNGKINIVNRASTKDFTKKNTSNYLHPKKTVTLNQFYNSDDENNYDFKSMNSIFISRTSNNSNQDSKKEINENKFIVEVENKPEMPYDLENNKVKSKRPSSILDPFSAKRNNTNKNSVKDLRNIVTFNNKFIESNVSKFHKSEKILNSKIETSEKEEIQLDDKKNLNILDAKIDDINLDENKNESKSQLLKNEINLDEININENGKEFILKENKKTEENDIFIHDEENIDMLRKNKKDDIKNKNKTKSKAKNEKQEKNFILLGQYFIEINNETKFYFVYYRKIKSILDILFYDCTEIKVAETISSENKIKHKLLSKIAHEFKTPLNSIIGLVSNLKNITRNIKIEKDLNLIQSLSNYTIYLINDIVQYASNDNFSNLCSISNKISEDFKLLSASNSNSIINSIPTPKNKVNINLFLRSVDIKKCLFFCFEILIALLSCNDTKKNMINIELRVDDRIKNIKIISDEIKINQILINFISNSIKFTKKGKILIIATLIEKNYYSYVKISVVDTGIGIALENQKILFSEKLALNTKHEFNQKGSGLGLSICLTLAKQLNIKIEFSSKENLGSSFSLIIPAIKLHDSSNISHNLINPNQHNSNNFISNNKTKQTFNNLEEKRSEEFLHKKYNKSIKRYNQYLTLHDRRYSIDNIYKNNWSAKKISVLDNPENYFFNLDENINKKLLNQPKTYKFFRSLSKNLSPKNIDSLNYLEKTTTYDHNNELKMRNFNNLLKIKNNLNFKNISIINNLDDKSDLKLKKCKSILDKKNNVFNINVLFAYDESGSDFNKYNKNIPIFNISKKSNQMNKNQFIEEIEKSEISSTIINEELTNSNILNKDEYIFNRRSNKFSKFNFQNKINLHGNYPIVENRNDNKSNKNNLINQMSFSPDPNQFKNLNRTNSYCKNNNLLVFSHAEYDDFLSVNKPIIVNNNNINNNQLENKNKNYLNYTNSLKYLSRKKFSKNSINSNKKQMNEIMKDSISNQKVQSSKIFEGKIKDVPSSINVKSSFLHNNNKLRKDQEKFQLNPENQKYESTKNVIFNKIQIFSDYYNYERGFSINTYDYNLINDLRLNVYDKNIFYHIYKNEDYLYYNTQKTNTVNSYTCNNTINNTLIGINNVNFLTNKNLNNKKSFESDSEYLIMNNNSVSNSFMNVNLDSKNLKNFDYKDIKYDNNYLRKPSKLSFQSKYTPNDEYNDTILTKKLDDLILTSPCLNFKQLRENFNETVPLIFKKNVKFQNLNININNNFGNLIHKKSPEIHHKRNNKDKNDCNSFYSINSPNDSINTPKNFHNLTRNTCINVCKENNLNNTNFSENNENYILNISKRSINSRNNKKKLSVNLGNGNNFYNNYMNNFYELKKKIESTNEKGSLFKDKIRSASENNFIYNMNYNKISSNNEFKISAKLSDLMGINIMKNHKKENFENINFKTILKHQDLIQFSFNDGNNKQFYLSKNNTNIKDSKINSEKKYVSLINNNNQDNFKNQNIFDNNFILFPNINIGFEKEYLKFDKVEEFSLFNDNINNKSELDQTDQSKKLLKIPYEKGKEKFLFRNKSHENEKIYSLNIKKFDDDGKNLKKKLSRTKVALKKQINVISVPKKKLASENNIVLKTGNFKDKSIQKNFSEKNTNKLEKKCLDQEKLDTMKDKSSDSDESVEHKENKEKIKRNLKCCCKGIKCNNETKEMDLNSNKNYFIIIDDNVYIRKTISNLLKITLEGLKKNKKYFGDFDIIEGGDGIDALKYVIDAEINGKIKAMLIDENMDYLNGSETVKIIRNLQNLNKINKFHIASVTSFEDVITKQNILNSGVNEIFPKPLTKSHLETFFQKYQILY